MKKLTIVILLFVLAFGAFAQQAVISVGVLYQPGDSLYGPSNGILSVIPEGWVGGVPEGSDLFILEATQYADAQMVVRAMSDNIDVIAERWQNGAQISRNIDLKPVGEVEKIGNTIRCEFSNLNNPANRTYAIAKCGDFGSCIAFFMNAHQSTYERGLVDLEKLVNATQLIEPYSKDIHRDFDWNKFLREKYIYSYLYDNTQEKVNNLWLCADGTFKMEIKRKGSAFVKENKAYYGNTSGMWSVEGAGTDAKVKLLFEKLSPYTFPIRIEDNRVYINGERHYVLSYKDCSK